MIKEKFPSIVIDENCLYDEGQYNINILFFLLIVWTSLYVCVFEICKEKNDIA